MKILLLATLCLLLYTLVVNCRQSDIPPSCNVSNPLEELDWLKAIVADTVATKDQSLSIQQATYKNQTVYLVYITPGPDRGVTTLYDCQGTALCKGYTTIAGLQTECKSVFNETQAGPVLYSR
ncbi:DUF6970 domain-containing protein [Spirosoma panaciterrae]|uniref:DUF6970 domain-containing protein n=1 Tax=Spirosoma panaciterrae TaxID=496058 RepID=UPI000379625B